MSLIDDAKSPVTPVTPEAGPEAGPEVLEYAREAGRLALEKKATDVLILDLRTLTSVCDYFVLVTADSDPQIKAVVESIEDGLKKQGQSPWHIEGMSNRQWVILDYVHFVVHVFRRESRENYLLERLWGDAPQEELGGTDDS